MTEIGNVTVRVDAVITDEQYHEAMSAVSAANERMDLLKAENAKLRERDGNLFNAIFAKNNELIDVLCENEKLRELARELWEGYADPPCEDCPLKDKPACVDCPICAREAAVIDRMRELGVEVPT